MTHDKIFKRENGTQYQVTASLLVGFGYDKEKYDYCVNFREKGKKKWLPLEGYKDRTPYGWNRDQTDEYNREIILSHVTLEEIYITKLELWQKIKPIKNHV